MGFYNKTLIGLIQLQHILDYVFLISGLLYFLYKATMTGLHLIKFRFL